MSNALGYQNNIWMSGAIVRDTNTVTVTAGRMYLQPLEVHSPVIVDEIGVDVTSGTAGNVRLGIYGATGEGKAGWPVVNGTAEIGTASTSTAGFKSVTGWEAYLPAGIYWLAALFSHTPTCTRNESVTTDQFLLGYTTTGSTRQIYGLYGAQAYANGLPSDATSFTTQVIGASTWSPFINLRATA